MKKTFVILISLAVLAPFAAQAQNVGACGWGSRLFRGEKGIAPQVLAVTTNGTSGNQTFAITSGTSGCTQNGVVKSNWNTAAYIDSNMNRLAMDISKGEGNSLDALAFVMGVDSEDQIHFNKTLKNNFAAIFPSQDTSSVEVTKTIQNILAKDQILAKYAQVA